MTTSLRVLVLLLPLVLRPGALGSPSRDKPLYQRLHRHHHHPVKVVGGVEASPHSLPYQVALIIDSKKLCGGVLISAQYVLTGAHCVAGSTNIDVVLGAHNIASYEDTQKIVSNPTVIVHESYNPKWYNNDIALLKLNKIIQLNWAIRPITHLAEKCSNFSGTTGLLSGWGAAKHESDYESKLRQAYLDVISEQRCQTYFKFVSNECHICTAGTDNMVGNVGACFGDSGGPLVVGDTLVGLVSFGNSTCDNGYPTVYTRISYYREWIAKYSGV